MTDLMALYDRLRPMLNPGVDLIVQAPLDVGSEALVSVGQGGLYVEVQFTSADLGLTDKDLKDRILRPMFAQIECTRAHTAGG